MEIWGVLGLSASVRWPRGIGCWETVESEPSQSLNKYGAPPLVTGAPYWRCITHMLPWGQGQTYKLKGSVLYFHILFCFAVVGEEKYLYFYPFEFLAEIPIIKDRLTREKQA